MNKIAQVDQDNGKKKYAIAISDDEDDQNEKYRKVDVLMDGDEKQEAVYNQFIYADVKQPEHYSNTAAKELREKQLQKN